MNPQELRDIRKGLGASRRTLSDADITRFAQDAEHSGFLVATDNGSAYSMPIPPFARHLLGDG